MLTVNTILTLISICLAFGTFLFALVKWIVKELRDTSTNIRAEMVSTVGGVKQELLTLRTNDLHHIYAELQEIRREKKNA